jgi:pimeloyl-ACP methyl ester carboxylesterase
MPKESLEINSTTKMVQANGHLFEVEELGTGERLALCLHGFPENALCWRHQMQALVDMGYRVWAPNQRGYGNSYRPEEIEAYDLTELCDDVGALIDASGAKSVTLIAHDWGAMVAWIFATRKIRPLEKLVIMNVPHPAVFLKMRNKAQIMRSWYVYFFQLPILPELLLSRNHGEGVKRIILRTAGDRKNFPEEILDVYRQNASDFARATAILNWYRALLQGGVQKQIKLGFPMIETPTLMIWGEADKALLKDTTYGTDKYVRDFTIRYLSGISHWVQQEAPLEVNEMLKAYLTDNTVPEYAELIKA